MELPRRDFLGVATSSFGLMATGSGRPAVGDVQGVIGPRATAKAVIWLFLEGGPSHIDTFDPKPQLDKRHGQPSGRPDSGGDQQRRYLASPFRFRRAGRSGIVMCDRFVHLADKNVADELCVYRGGQAVSARHPEAMLHFNTGSRRPGGASLGAHVTHRLHSGTANLPGYVVMTQAVVPQGGAANWSAGSLPGHVRGVTLADADLSTESQRTLDAYGIDRPGTDAAGRQCLASRQLVQAGARFVQIYCGGWDSHDDLRQGHAARIAAIDRPIAALIADLKRHGLLDQTLIVCGGEFGRSPAGTYRDDASPTGRDHNADAMTIWFAGGGVKAGATVGATDELGGQAVQCVGSIDDIHATILHLLGIDATSWAPSGGGHVIRELIA